MQILVLHDFTLHGCRGQDRIDAEHKDLQLAFFKAWPPWPVIRVPSPGSCRVAGTRRIWRRTRRSMLSSPTLMRVVSSFFWCLSTNGHFDREHHDDPLEFLGYTIVSFSLGCLRYARACQRVPVPADVYRWLDFLQLTTRSDDQLNSVCWAQNIPFTLYESSDRPFISS